MDDRALAAWFTAADPSITPPLTLDLLSGGHSNLTYRVTDAAGRRFVLRRPPEGAAGIHDVVREHRVAGALAGAGVPVAPLLGVCTDDEVLGVPFGVSGWVDGHVVETPADADAVLAGPARITAAEQLVDVLVALHAVDVHAVGLGELLRPESYATRQLRRMGTLWERTRTRPLAIVDEVRERLERGRPQAAAPGLVHGDYRLGNVMVDGAGRILAVLDWELATHGEPLADLAFLLGNWEEPDEGGRTVWMADPPTRAGGFPSRAALVERYAARSGRDVSDLPYYRALSLWRTAVIAEGMLRRYTEGRMGDTAVDFDHLRERVPRFAELAREQLAAHA